MIGTTLDARYRRARKDPLGTMLVAATEAGVRFRWAGADLQVDCLDRLPPADQVLLARHMVEITERLAEPGDDGEAAIAALGIEATELVTSEARARAVVRALPPEVGLDCETEASVKRPAIALTRKGASAKRQPTITDKAGLNPRIAKVRLLQVYDPSNRTVLVFDLHYMPLAALTELWDRHLWIHNAGFEATVLGAQGVRLPHTIDTIQMAGLLYGCAPGARRLETVCGAALGVEVSKGQQLSDWSAPRLSRAQRNYAAIDAAVAYEAGRAMVAQMDERLRRCFRLQNAVVAVVAKMRLTGAPFVRAVHLDTIERWERELAEKRAAFIELTGEEPPARHKVGAWVEAHMPADEIAWMPRTVAGGLSARGALLKYLAHHEEIRPLLRVLWARKRLENFGITLLELIDPTTQRIYPDYLTCAAKSGRLASSNPNAQQLPGDGRGAVKAPPGRRLIRADLDQIELRVFAEEANEQVMRAVFAAGGDIHRRTAASIAGVPEDEIDKHDPRRKAAKAINFGIVYAAGPRTIRASAWAKFDIDMSEDEARAAQAAVFRTYPAIRAYQQRQDEIGRNARVIHSRAGRPLRADWEKDGILKYTTCSNFPIQSSAADILLRSMVLLDRELADLDAQLILSVHDELVVEAAADVAPEVEQRMIRAMTRAFSELYPDAPTVGLVDTRIVEAWGDPD